MDNAHEICTRWLSAAEGQNGAESCEFEAGRIVFHTSDE
jgi:hypothetical protein